MSKNKKTILTTDPSLAAKTLERGGIVLFPTETVYGIGTDSRNLQACLEIYKIKGRPSDNPLIVHVSDWEQIRRIAEVPIGIEVLLQEFLPGPLTLILPKKDPLVFSAGLDTIGVRIPSHAKTREMLRIFAGPVSAPSANLSGKPSITRYEDALEEFDGKVDLILKGEEPEIGLESTVLDLSSEIPKILRPGFFELERLQTLLPKLIKEASGEGSERPLSPGMKYRHYSPNAKVILAEADFPPDLQAAAIGIQISGGWKSHFSAKDNLEYMQNLYSFFRDCDRKGIERIYCFPPEQSTGKDAILNRIRKASES